MPHKSRKAQNIRVIKDEDRPETPEVLAASIIAISKAFSKLSNQGITRRGIVILLKDMPGMRDASIPTIDLVLDNLPKLASYYVRKTR